MVRALIEGRKSQTRRPLYVVRNMKETGELPPSRYFPDYPPPHLGLNQIATLGTAHLIQPGDRLWVKETWRTMSGADGLKPTALNTDCRIEYLATPEGLAEGKTRVSLFMRRWMSRLTLTVTDVRIERLQDISREDAIAEGIQRVGGGMLRWENWSGAEGQSGSSPQAAYGLLWNSINGAGSWNANPWVVRICFAVEMRNIDHV